MSARRPPALLPITNGATPGVPANNAALYSTFQLGTWNPLNDTFTLALDLNDGVTFRIHPQGLKLTQPDKTIIESMNVRTAGAVVPRWQYKPRHIQVELSINVAGSTVAALLAQVGNLIAAVEQPPYCIKLALPGSPHIRYADVIAVKHDIPSDTQQILAKAIMRVHIDFECRVGLRGDRQVLQNLVPNPGFEQPSGTGVTVFNDTFANINFYTYTGSPATVAGNILTIPQGQPAITFGSPAWGAVQQWLIRFEWFTGLEGRFLIHYTNGANYLAARITPTSHQLIHVINGVTTTLDSHAITPVDSTWYWLQITQFPALPGEAPDVQSIFSADNSGVLGSTISTAGPVPTADAMTALTGPMAFQSLTVNLQISVNTVKLFGPGGWLLQQTGGGAAAAYSAGAWEGGGYSATNTYPSGPVSSYGALRMDAPRTGSWDNRWYHYAGGNPAGSYAIAALQQQTLSGSAWVKTSGLSGTAAVSILIHEYDTGGVLLRSGAIASLSGNQSAWTPLSGSYTTGVNCAYVAFGCRALDTTSNSAGGVVWFDNALLWNQTAVAAVAPNQSGMPWCDLRAAQGPAQMVVSGILGDMAAPAQFALGTYTASWPAGGTFSLYVGRKATTSPTAMLVRSSHGAYAAAYTPQATALLDSSAYGGFTATTAAQTPNAWETLFTSPTASDASGVYHLLTRFKSALTGGNLAKLEARVKTTQQTDSWLNNSAKTDIVAQGYGSWVFPIGTSNAWTLVDVGQATLPPFPQGALNDPGGLYLVPRAQWSDTSGVGAAGYSDYLALLPIDGVLLMATVNNPSNSVLTVATEWLWVYSDGLLLNRSAPGDTAAWTTSLESGPTPNAAKGAGGVGTTNTGSVNVNSTADPCLTLDPTTDGANGFLGVNQIVALLSDQAATVAPLYGELAYSPLYLYPW